MVAGTEEFRVEAMRAGCQIVYGGALYDVQRVQPGPKNTYVVTDEFEGERTFTDTEGVEHTQRSYKTLVFATGTWVKGIA